MSSAVRIKYCLLGFDITQLSRRPPHFSEALFAFILVVEKCLVYSNEGESRFHSTALYGVIHVSHTTILIDNTLQNLKLFVLMDITKCQQHATYLFQ